MRRFAEPENEVFVSAASVWEAAIKAQIEKLVLPSSFLSSIRDSGFMLLSITEEHAFRAARLPMHHTDPFDRMLCAQAASEGLTIVTRDMKIVTYGVPVMMS